MPRHYADWIEGYLSLVRGKTEAPEIFNFWSAVSTIAAALTRNVYLDEVRYRYYPNFYIVLAARPGVAKKSTAMDECTSLLRDIASDRFGPSETNWPALCQEIASRTQVAFGDGDDESLDAPHEVQCAITLCLREFGTFLKPTDQAMIEGLTDLWDSTFNRVYVKSTKFSGVDHIQNPFVNIIGATTATWLRHNFAIFAGWGIASRIIFVHSDEESTPIFSPADLIDPIVWNETRRRLQDDLQDIMTIKGVCAFEPPARSAARTWYERQFYETLAYGKRDDADTWVSDFLARKQAHVHKLAMVLSAARRNNLFITLKDFTDATQHIDVVETELRRIFSARLSPSQAAATERAIYAEIHHALSNGLAGRAPRTEIMNRVARYVDSATADLIIKGFLKRGLFAEWTDSHGVSIVLPTYKKGNEDGFSKKE